MLPLMRSADLVIVQGDTSSALGGALAAGLAEVPVAHVEAGLRSHDRRRPWPEEEFRLAIDSQAALLFAATELSVANLRRERVPGQIHLTGNTGIDAALRSAPPSRAKSRDRELPRLLVTCHRRESWGGGFISIADALRRLAREKTANIDLVLHPSPALAAQMRLLLGGEPRIRLRDPCSHSELIREIVAADLVLSDSGGIQEEAAALGIPIVVLRERTERPEAIATGHLTLTGLDSLSIVETARTMLSRRPSDLRACPYGDGRAAPRIAAIVADWLTERRLTRTSLPEAEHSATFTERKAAT